MQLQAPAIAEFRPAGLDTAKLATWLRGIGVRQVRIACGLVMFSYIFSHFFNHALGNISYPAMEAWLYLHIWWWRIPVVNDTLYAAAAIHFRWVCGRSISGGIFATRLRKSPNSYWV